MWSILIKFPIIILRATSFYICLNSRKKFTKLNKANCTEANSWISTGVCQQLNILHLMLTKAVFGTVTYPTPCRLTLRVIRTKLVRDHSRGLKPLSNQYTGLLQLSYSLQQIKFFVCYEPLGV